MRGYKMALKKKIKRANGIELEYHRIAMVKVETNQQITILVESYLNADGRQTMKDYSAGLINEQGITFPYTDGDYISFDYDSDPEMFKGNIIQKAYNWLKKQDSFKDAEDV
jgi:hypothetical protein